MADDLKGQDEMIIKEHPIKCIEFLSFIIIYSTNDMYLINLHFIQKTSKIGIYLNYIITAHGVLDLSVYLVLKVNSCCAV